MVRVRVRYGFNEYPTSIEDGSIRLLGQLHKLAFEIELGQFLEIELGQFPINLLLREKQILGCIFFIFNHLDLFGHVKFINLLDFFIIKRICFYKTFSKSQDLEPYSIGTK